MSNILLELERRQRTQPEWWQQELPARFIESWVVEDIFRCSGQFHEVIKDTRSTATIVFSKDGKWMASGHNNHKIYIFQAIPPRFTNTLTLAVTGHHTRTPWCLEFDPTTSSILFSGCLGGVVCKWNIHTGDFLQQWQSSTSRAISSLVFSLSSPELIFVSCDCHLHLLNAHSLDTVWETDTGWPDLNMRLVMHHPLENTILTAITNPLERSLDILECHAIPNLAITFAESTSAYRVQMYSYDNINPPDLKDKHHQLLCKRAVVFGHHSIVLTSRYVVLCEVQSITTNLLTIYSILPHNFGTRLRTIVNDGVFASLDVSHFSSLLLVGLRNHLRVHRITENDSTMELEILDSDWKLNIKNINTLRWVPGGGLLYGTSSGSICYWGTDHTA